MWHNLGRSHNATVIRIECVLARELHQKRIESRIRNMLGIPEVSWEDVENARKIYVPWKEERLVIDTATTHETNVKKALEYIHRKVWEQEGG